jgi:Ni/Co efflux regulator RcnB
MKKKLLIPVLVAAFAASAAAQSFAQDRYQRSDRGYHSQDQRSNDRNDNQRGDYQRGERDRGNYQDRNDRNDRRDNAYGRGDQARNDRWDGAGPRHDLRRGAYLPSQYRSRQYVVDDWRGHRLRQPPRGYHWVQTGGDYVLAAIATGIIADLLINH